MAEVDLNYYCYNPIFFFSAIAAALSYSYFISSTLPTGIPRLIFLLPVFSLFTLLPLLLSSAFAAAIAAFCFTWLANFKLILFAFDHPPLHPPKSLAHFITIASLPAKIKPHSIQSDPKPSSNVPIVIESFAFPVLIHLVFNHNHNHKLNGLDRLHGLHGLDGLNLINSHVVLMIIYCFLIFMLIDLMVFVSNVLIWAVAGVELEPPSDEPYLATSLQDFWGRRWNLTVGHILRQTVYRPVKFLFSGTDWGWVPAVLATFGVSGLMHELLFWYVTRGSTPTWEMTSFFVLHGVGVVVELVVKRAVAGKVEFPVAVSRLLTVGFVVATSFWLFFPPLIESGADVKVLEEFKVFVDYVKTMIKT